MAVTVTVSMSGGCICDFNEHLIEHPINNRMAYHDTSTGRANKVQLGMDISNSGIAYRGGGANECYNVVVGIL